MRLLRGLSVAIALAAWMGPAAAQQQRPVQTHQRAVAPKAASHLTDAQLEKLIRDRIARSTMSAEKFTVRVQGGVATIEGRTDVIQHKGAATRLAKAAGAVGVNNRIQLSDATRRKAAGNLEQGRRRKQVKRGDARSEASSQPSAISHQP